MARVPSSTTVRNVVAPATTRMPFVDTALSRIVLAPTIDRHASYPDTLRFPYGAGNIMWKGQFEILPNGYDLYDAVYNNGSSYVSNTIDNHDEPPHSTWDLLAQEGDVAAATGEYTMPLSWGDVSTQIILEVPAGSLVMEVHFCVTEVFNGTGFSLSIGDAANHSRLMAVTDSDMSSLGTYNVYPTYLYAVSTDVSYYFTNGGAGASTGAGLIVINIVD